MSEQNKPHPYSLLSGLSSKDQKRALKELKKTNKHAAKHNRLIKQQIRQAALEYELTERQYLIDKSALQPKFRLTVTEFLTCEPDFVNDPEQASEAKFLADRGVRQDQRALKIRLESEGGAPYMHPNILFKQKGQSNHDDRIYAMNEKTFFIDIASLDLTESTTSTMAYLVYRDRTTLPVLHQYQLTQRQGSALLRWDVQHLDTVYATNKDNTKTLNTHSGCAELFSDVLCSN